MNPFIQQLINQKIKALTSAELIQYSEAYNIRLSNEEAVKIIKILHSQKPISIGDDAQHRSIIRLVAREINPNIAKKVNELLNEFKKMI